MPCSRSIPPLLYADKSIVSAQIAACSLILDRGCGKAGQSLPIAVDLKERISELSHEELLRLRETYMAAIGPEPTKLIEHNEKEVARDD